MTEYKRIALEEFDAKIRTGYVEVSSASLGGKVLSCSDDFFASKDNLIKLALISQPSASMKGQFGPTGALYDGWESRRHNQAHDWVIIKLAPALSHIHYVDIDTSHFSGNEAPFSSVHALRLEPGSNSEAPLKLSNKDPRWEEILPVVELGPNSRHIFEIGAKGKEGTWSALMVGMIPDGGMARFRAYGLPILPTPHTSLPDPSTPTINLLDPLLGARIITCSDANFSPPGNLLLPGRGHDMSDGWETRRSQLNRGKYGKGGALEGKERSEWVVARLAGTGVVRYVEVDTAYHPGNYPVACKVEAILSDEDLPSEKSQWTVIVDKKPLGSHRQHWFDVERSVPTDQVFSHVRLSTFPDGGLKRFRVFGHSLSPSSSSTTTTTATSAPPNIPALPLTVEAFKPYGDVIQGFDLPTSAPKGIDVALANQGTAWKINRLAKVEETYPTGYLKKGGLGIGVIRQQSHYETKNGCQISVTTLERHAATTQAFIPMGKTAPEGTDELPAGGAYIAVVALNGEDDKPDLSTLRAFLITSSQGVSYHAGIWHHAMLSVDGPGDYACVEAQVGEPGLLMDCENYTPPTPYCTIIVPPYSDQSRPSGPKPKSSVAGPNGTSPAHSHPHKAADHERHSVFETVTSFLSDHTATTTTTSHHPTDPTHPVHPVPITPELFAPFGALIRAYPNVEDRGAGQEVLVNEKGKAEKYTRLAPILSTYPVESGAVPSIGVYRATKKIGLERGKVFDVRYMERHPYTTQAFIPMNKGVWEGKGVSALPPGGAFLVVVAKNGPDDRPDPSTLRSFVMESSSGLSYAAGTWHHPVLVLDSTLDLACVETQVSTGVRQDPDARDCELLTWEGEEVFGRIAVPEL